MGLPGAECSPALLRPGICLYSPYPPFTTVLWLSLDSQECLLLYLLRDCPACAKKCLLWALTYLPLCFHRMHRLSPAGWPQARHHPHSLSPLNTLHSCSSLITIPQHLISWLEFIVPQKLLYYSLILWAGIDQHGHISERWWEVSAPKAVRAFLWRSWRRA